MQHALTLKPETDRRDVSAGVASMTAGSLFLPQNAVALPSNVVTTVPGTSVQRSIPASFLWPPNL